LIQGLCSLYPALGQGALSPAAPGIQISGRYAYIHRLHLNETRAQTNWFDFEAQTGPAGWRILATNENNAKEWGMLRSDGTSLYALGTEEGNGFWVGANAGTPIGGAYPGQFYMPHDQDSVHLFFPWMVFHLTAPVIRVFEKNGVLEMPPSWGSRSSLIDYGYQWNIPGWTNNRIIQQIDVVRDSALDLPTPAEELGRPNVDYPFTEDSRTHVLEALRVRKEVSNGFIRATYRCGEVLETNGWQIPATAEFALFWPNPQDSRGPGMRLFTLTLQVNQINPRQNGGIAEENRATKTLVCDYRFQATNARTKFNYATCTLNAGDSFSPANDPALRAQADDWLKNGPGYKWGQSNRGAACLGILGVVVIFGLLVRWFRPQSTGRPGERE
jgi:hypothetical protein